MAEETPATDVPAVETGTPASVRVLQVGYALGVPGTVAAPWIMRRRMIPAFVALEAGMVLITTGWAMRLPRRRAIRGVVINGLGTLGYIAWWRSAGKK
jgi:hypothetical protein